MPDPIAEEQEDPDGRRLGTPRFYEQPPRLCPAAVAALAEVRRRQDYIDQVFEC